MHEPLSQWLWLSRGSISHPNRMCGTHTHTHCLYVCLCVFTCILLFFVIEILDLGEASSFCGVVAPEFAFIYTFFVRIHLKCYGIALLESKRAHFAYKLERFNINMCALNRCSYLGNVVQVRGGARLCMWKDSLEWEKSHRAQARSDNTELIHIYPSESRSFVSFSLLHPSWSHGRFSSSERVGIVQANSTLRSAG